MSALRLIANIIWLMIAGIPLALAYALAGVLACIFIVTIPFGIASFRLAVYALWPFGQTIVDRPDAGVASAIGNIIWFIIAGWWLALTHIIIGVGFIVTIIGIPFGIASFKMATAALLPLGKEIVSTDELGRYRFA